MPQENAVSPRTSAPGARPTLTLRGSPQFPEVAGGLPPSSIDAMDEAVATVRSHAAGWAALPVGRRIAILDQLIAGVKGVAERWICACMDAKGFAPGEARGEEWLTGPHPLLRNLRLLRDALAGIRRHGAPRIPGPVVTLPNGQVSARVFPADLYDRLLFQGVTVDVWMEPSVTLDNLQENMASAYRRAPEQRSGKVCLVLAAGNASCIGPMDALYKLFVENQAVVYKSHPVNACLGPLLEEAFRALVEPGYLRVVHGGAAEGAYLCVHPGVDEVHMTGSDKTFDAIMFGSGEEGTIRKAERRPRLAKRVTAELGNISPVIVVPGPWSAADLAYQAENVATMLTTNAGYFCATSRLIVQHAGWGPRHLLLDAVGRILAQVPARRAYYPGAAERHAAFLAAHPEGELYGGAAGDDGAGRLPWTLIRGLDPAAPEEMCYSTEAFCPLFAETGLAAASVPEFIDRAVAFANERLWGSLAATIIVHPRSMAEPAVARAVERAIADLRYGTVAVNHWALVNYSLVAAPWGAYPGNDIYDVGSGIGVVHNTLMFDRPQKSVLRGPFRAWPKPPWFATFGAAEEAARGLTYFEAAPGPATLARVVVPAVRG